MVRLQALSMEIDLIEFIHIQLLDSESIMDIKLSILELLETLIYEASPTPRLALILKVIVLIQRNALIILKHPLNPIRLLGQFLDSLLWSVQMPPLPLMMKCIAIYNHILKCFGVDFFEPNYQQ